MMKTQPNRKVSTVIQLSLQINSPISKPAIKVGPTKCFPSTVSQAKTKNGYHIVGSYSMQVSPAVSVAFEVEIHV